MRLNPVDLQYEGFVHFVRDYRADLPDLRSVAL